MENKEDTPFWITSFFEDKEHPTQNYKSIKNQILNQGYIIYENEDKEDERVKVYTPELAVIFDSRELPVRNMDTEEDETINGFEYFQTYVKGFKEGEQYFETGFKVSPNIIFGAESENYVNHIHFNFFHEEHTFQRAGWVHIKQVSSMTLSHKSIKKYGYYSGIVSKVEELIKKYPLEFANFYNCDNHSDKAIDNLAFIDIKKRAEQIKQSYLTVIDKPEQTETKTDKLKAKLGKYGFFELLKVKQLSEPNKQNLIELISKNKMPYRIAMFDYLGFLKYLKDEHLKTNDKLFKEVSNWFDVTERVVKGNIYVLNEFSKENRKRYTADKEKQTAQTNYQKLK